MKTNLISALLMVVFTLFFKSVFAQEVLLETVTSAAITTGVVRVANVRTAISEWDQDTSLVPVNVGATRRVLDMGARPLPICMKQIMVTPTGWSGSLTLSDTRVSNAGASISPSACPTGALEIKRSIKAVSGSGNIYYCQAFNAGFNNATGYTNIGTTSGVDADYSSTGENVTFYRETLCQMP